MTAANGYDVDIVGRCLAKQFMWLCACATSACTSLSELVDFKYRNICPYCGKNVCCCDASKRETRLEKNARMMAMALERFEERRDPPDFSFEGCRAMFGRIYSQNSDRMDLSEMALHAASETAEAIDAAMRLRASDGAKSYCALQLEFSDMIAWFFAFVNAHRSMRGESYDFEGVLMEMIADGCYSCKCQPCACGSDLAPEEWRGIIDEARVAR